MKKFNIGTIKMTMESNGFPKGFILKRKLTVRECKYILKTLLGIEVEDRDSFYNNEEYADYNEQIAYTINEWLIGNTDDDAVMSFAADCADEPIGIMNLIPIICYLQKKNII